MEVLKQNYGTQYKVKFTLMMKIFLFQIIQLFHILLKSTGLNGVAVSHRTEFGYLWRHFTASFLQQSCTFLCIWDYVIVFSPYVNIITLEVSFVSVTLVTGITQVIKHLARRWLSRF